eukprot:3039295-Pyramimonas_sp.AAC.1
MLSSIDLPRTTPHGFCSKHIGNHSLGHGWEPDSTACCTRRSMSLASSCLLSGGRRAHLIGHRP